MRTVCQRLIHRYVGREHGGHRGVGWSLELPREVEQTVQRRSDLAGEDLGGPVPPYLAGYPLPDGRYALGRTLYLTDADCLGAVRTETLLVEPDAQAALPDPFDLAAALEGSPELGGAPAGLKTELRRFQEARAPGELAPLAIEVAAPSSPAHLLAPLRALEPALLRAVVEGACGALPLCLVGEAAGVSGVELLRALLQLYPRGAQWQAAFCTQALSPRPWAALQLVPRAAADRFVLRAAREADVAVVDLASGVARNVEASPASETIVELVAQQAWGELDDLARRAGQLAAYRTPGDLGALLRYEALARAVRRGPEEQVELANHLRARGAPEHEVAEPFRQLLLDPPDGRLVWLVNVVQTGWLAYRRAHDQAPDDAPEAVRALLERTLAAQRFDLTLGFLERMWPLYPDARQAVEDAAVVRALGDDAIEPAAGPALLELLLVAAERAPSRVAQALAHRAPLAGPEALERLEAALERVDAEPVARRRASVALLDAAAAAGAWPVFEREAQRALGAPWCSVELLSDVGLRAAALPDSPVRDGALGALFSRVDLAHALVLDALLRRLRGDPAALTLAGQALLARVDEPAVARAGGARLVLRLAALARRRGLVDLAARARLRVQRLRRAERGGRLLIERAARAVRVGAWTRAASDLALARTFEQEGHPRPRDAGAFVTGEVAAFTLDDDETGTGRLSGRDLDAEETGFGTVDTGMGRPDLNLDPLGADDTGVSLALPTDARAAYRDVLRVAAVTPSTPEQVAAVCRHIPDAAWDLPWDDLVGLAGRLDGNDLLERRLAEAASGPMGVALTGGQLPLAPEGAPARAAIGRALVRALVLEATDADPVRWLELVGSAVTWAGEPPGTRLVDTAAAVLGRVAPQGIARALDAALPLAQRLPDGHLLARAAVDAALRALPPGRAAADPGAPARLLAALAQTLRPADDAGLMGELARRVREGPLELEAFAALGGGVLDGVLSRLGDGFSLRLQNGLRRLVFNLAEAHDPTTRALIGLALDRLRPHVAADRAFRADVAQGLRSRLGVVAGAAGEPLTRAIAAFES